MHPAVLQFFKKHAHVDRELCVFESTGWRRASDKAEVVVCKRSGCRRHAITKQGPSRVFAHCRHPRVMVGNLIGDAIKLCTLGAVAPTPECNCNARRVMLNAIFGFNVPRPVVWVLERLGKHKTQPLPWDNPKVRGDIEIGESVS